VAVEQYTAKYADRLVALTATEQREHLDLGIGTRNQWSIVHSGINFSDFERNPAEGQQVRRELGISPGATLIGTVGRLVPVKGQCHLIEAFAKVRDAHPGAELLIVGDGELREDLLKLAHSLRLTVRDAWNEDSRKTPSGGGTVHFVGLRRDVRRLLTAMDIFALPSLNEGMGRVLVEAMAMELPCVASRVSGVPDVVRDGQTGTLVPAADPEGLATALIALANDPERVRAMGRLGRDCVVPAMSEGVMVEKLTDLYRLLLSEKGYQLPPLELGERSMQPSLELLSASRA
jgi:glycosyltransferase involved in cell wall biosynthesis